VGSQLDKTASNSGTAITTLNTGTTAALTQANELVLAAISINALTSGGNYAAQSPFSPSQASPVPSSPAGYLAAGNLITTSTAGVSCTFNWTSSTGARAVIATYKLGSPRATGHGTLELLGVGS
jgi:hypothetical protein